MRYAALTVQNWLCERIEKAGGSIPEAIRCTSPANYMDIPSSALKSSKLPFSEIISLPDQGIWALMVREPDPNIAARSFVTHVGLRVGGDGAVEFGVYIDIVDRDRELSEKDKAYRPQFVRLLFETEGMTLSQAGPLAFREYTAVSDRRGVARLKALADDRENQLPLVVFTHAKEAQLTASDMDRIIAEIMKMPPQRTFGFQTSPLPEQKKPTHFMPYDTQEFARHTYGFARVYVVSAEMFSEFRSKFNRNSLNEGDVLIVEPKAFGGTMRSILYREGLNDAWYRGAADELQNTLQCYSKHKPFSFGNVLFEDDARQYMRDQELAAIRASVHMEKSDELQQVLVQLEKERSTSAEQTRYINDLRAQMRDEYNRGAKSAGQQVENLKAQLDQVRADNAKLKATNESMQQAFTEFRAMKEITERVQSVEKMPRSNEDVLSYFQLFFSDRIGFTDRGLKTASKCEINPDMLWSCLYQVAKVLVNMYRDGIQNIDKAFKERTGWDLALTEGPETHKVADYMNLRKDNFEGREISVEPHIKFPKSAQKTGAQYQRLYYAYDPQSRKVIVGYVGDHLDNYLTLGFH